MVIEERIAADLGLSSAPVRRTIELIEAGATIPFIAHYRKEDTGGLSIGRIARIADRYRAFRELESRKEAVIQSIDEQGRLTDDLRAAIAAVTERSDLEDLYYPYRPKPVTKAQKAVESGLEPLADLFWAQGTDERPLDEIVAPFIDPAKEVPDANAALAGARVICAERVAAIPALRKALRRMAWETGQVASRPADGADDRAVAKLADIAHLTEPVSQISTARVMSLRRGEKDGVISVRVIIDRETALAECRRAAITNVDSPFLDQIELALEDAYDRLLAPVIEGDVRGQLREGSDQTAIDLIAANLQDLLLEPPFGAKTVLGIVTAEQGYAAAVVDAAGACVETATLDQAGSELLPEAEVTLARMIEAHKPAGVVLARVPASALARRVVEDLLGRIGVEAAVAALSESEAGVYANSPVGRDDFPDMDPTHRKAVSLARRLQDPLMELVKIDPRSVGSSPYHHDVDRTALLDRLLRVTTLAVSTVGADLNTAHYRPISFVAGIGPVLAKNITTFREGNGGFRTRSALHQVKKMTPTAFQQCAGYLRVDGENPLDKTAIHPERYPVVEKMAADLETDLPGLFADPAKRAALEFSRYLDAEVGEPTLEQIRRALTTPWTDPRGDFKPPPRNEGVGTVNDLKTGARLKGVITNVTDYGAFVDVGILQDGLVHLSQLSHRRVIRPQDAVRIGQEVEVAVTDVDVRRSRISLSIRAAEPKPERRPRPAETRPRPVAPPSRLDGPPAPGEDRAARPPRPDDPRRDRRPDDRRRDGDRRPPFDRAAADRGGDGNRPGRFNGDRAGGDRPPRSDRGDRPPRGRDRGESMPRQREPEGYRPFANLMMVNGELVIKPEEPKKKS